MFHVKIVLDTSPASAFARFSHDRAHSGHVHMSRMLR
jgi:hypothetical protein